MASSLSNLVDKGFGKLNINIVVVFLNIISWYEYRTKKKMILKKDFFKLIINSISGKTMKNVRKHWDTKFVAT